ncbi:curli-like amyloid fiber formation chaperone CsgH [Mesorhizobium sp. M0047]|uniref:curli-like amyloid fiber formation chaperone CsgH n=1 Tax=Mesorhizobium sp. M0047 TaxID=2956859 RepID=UPI0033372F73
MEMKVMDIQFCAPKQSRPCGRALASVLISAGALAAMATAVPRAGALQDPATQEGGMVSLEALAHADKSVSGTYSFHVESAARTGDTNIGQDGAFSTRQASYAQRCHARREGRRL